MTRRSLSIAASILWCALLPVPASSQGPVGSSFRIDSSSSLSIYPSVSAAADGRFVVVWYDRKAPFDNDTIRGRLYDAEGSPVTMDQIPISTYTEGRQADPVVSMAPNGDFVVTWKTFSVGFQGQRFASDGLPIGEYLQISQSNPGGQSGLAADEQRFVVSYPESSAKVRIFDNGSGALGLPIIVNQEPAPAMFTADVGMDLSGDFVVAWDAFGGAVDSRDGAVYARRFSSDGTPKDDQFQVNVPVEGIESWLPSVGVGPNGNFVVAWYSSTQEIRARRYASSGAVLGEEILVGDSSFGAPDVSLAADGAFVVAIDSYQPSPGVRVFDAAGQPASDRLPVTSGPSSRPAVAMDERGRFVVVFDTFNYSYPGIPDQIGGQVFSSALFKDGFESGDLSRWGGSSP